MEEQPRYELRKLMFLAGTAPSMSVIREVATWFPVRQSDLPGRFFSNEDLAKEVRELIFNK